MRFPLSWAEQNANTEGAEAFHAALEAGVRGKGGVDEWQYYKRDAQARRLGQNAERVSVANAQRPLVDGVVGRRGDDDRVGVWQRASRAGAWLRIFGSHRIAGLLFDCINVEEVQRGGSRDDVDVPPAVARPFNQLPNRGCGTGPQTTTYSTRDVGWSVKSPRRSAARAPPPAGSRRPERPPMFRRLTTYCWSAGKLLWREALCGAQRLVGLLVLAPLEIGAGNVDQKAGFPFSDRDLFESTSLARLRASPALPRTVAALT